MGEEGWCFGRKNGGETECKSWKAQNRKGIRCLV